MTPKLQAQGFSAGFATQTVVQGITLDIHAGERLAIIGPAGSGKTTFLRSLNRLNDFAPSFHHTGKILRDGVDIYSPELDVAELRRSVGMVYAVPTPLPWSIRENLAFGLKLHGDQDRGRLRERTESALRHAFLWDEVKNRLDDPAQALSGGQQQRLCIARALVLNPEVLLLDEPCSGLDPIATAKIEESLIALAVEHAILLVTNNPKQAARASDRVAFFLRGELVEIGPTAEFFTRPREKRTNDYLQGLFG